MRKTKSNLAPHFDKVMTYLDARPHEAVRKHGYGPGVFEAINASLDVLEMYDYLADIRKKLMMQKLIEQISHHVKHHNTPDTFLSQYTSNSGEKFVRDAIRMALRKHYTSRPGREADVIERLGHDLSVLEGDVEPDYREMLHNQQVQWPVSEQKKDAVLAEMFAAFGEYASAGVTEIRKLLDPEEQLDAAGASSVSARDKKNQKKNAKKAPAKGKGKNAKKGLGCAKRQRSA